MKIIMTMAFAILCGLSGQAQDSTQQHSDNPANPPGGEVPQVHYRPSWSGVPDKYCVTMMGGKLTVVHKGKPIVENEPLGNGTRIMKDGTLILPDGTRRSMKNKDCIDASGNGMP